MKKRLFKCSAYINIKEKKNGYDYTLISYNTKICHVVITTNDDGWENVSVALWRYPSNTSQKHIHKFAKWLRQNDEYSFARWLRQNDEYSSAGRIVELLQKYCVETKCNYGIYDGTFKARDFNRQTLKKLGFEYNIPY